MNETLSTIRTYFRCDYAIQPFEKVKLVVLTQLKRESLIFCTY